MNGSGPRHLAVLDGKNVVVSGKSQLSSLDELRGHLRRHPTHDLLAALGTLAAKIETSTEQGVHTIGNTVVMPHMIASAAVLAIESSNDHRNAKRRIDDAYLERLFDLFIRLPDPLTLGQGGAESFMVRAGESQFIYQGERRHQLPRVRLILGRVWQETEKARQLIVDPLVDYRTMVGIDLDEALLIAMAFQGCARAGVVEPFGSRVDYATDPALAEATSIEKRRAFLTWATADYAMIREAGKAREMPDESFVRYRFNPLRTFPLVRSDTWICGASKDAVFLPIPHLVYERATLGTLYALADLHSRSNTNHFRAALGHAFQAYVGLLLREALGTEHVREEWTYGPQNIDTPDWIVIEDHRAVVIEVKHSALYLETKQWGNATTLRDDLMKSIGKAVAQLARFKAASEARAAGLEPVHGLELQLLVVTLDRLHYANSVVRDAVEDISTQLKLDSVPHVHIVPVEAFEYVLGECEGGSLFELLDEKRRDAVDDRMDFGDWLSGRKNVVLRNRFLSEEFDRFFARYGVGK